MPSSQEIPNPTLKSLHKKNQEDKPNLRINPLLNRKL